MLSSLARPCQSSIVYCTMQACNDAILSLEALPVRRQNAQYLFIGWSSQRCHRLTVSVVQLPHLSFGPVLVDQTLGFVCLNASSSMLAPIFYTNFKIRSTCYTQIRRYSIWQFVEQIVLIWHINCRMQTKFSFGRISKIVQKYCNPRSYSYQIIKLVAEIYRLKQTCTKISNILPENHEIRVMRFLLGPH